MDVLENHQYRVARGKPLDLSQLRLKRLLLAFLWCEIEGCVTVPDGNPEQIGEQRHRGSEVIGAFRKQRLQLLQPFCGSVIAAQVCRTFELGDARMKGAVLAMR
jgi:hypothetical protein